MINPNIQLRVYVVVNEDGKTATLTRGKNTGKSLELVGKYYDTVFKPGTRLRPYLKYSIIQNSYWLDARKS